MATTRDNGMETTMEWCPVHEEPTAIVDAFTAQIGFEEQASAPIGVLALGCGHDLQVPTEVIDRLARA